MRDTNKTRKRKSGQKMTHESSPIDIPPFLKTVAPGDDFYKYVNGNWLRTTTIPPFHTSHGVSEEVEASIEEQLQTILKRAYTFSEKGKRPETKHEEMLDLLGRFALSLLRKEKQKYSVESLQRNLRYLLCIRDSNEISYQLGSFNRHGISTLLSLGIFKKLSGKVQYTFTLSPGSLGLPDLSYYKATAPGKTRTLLSYVAICRKISKELAIPDISHAIQLESGVSPVLQESLDDDYVDMKGSELETKFPEIGWESLFEGYGLTKHSLWREKVIRVYSLQWLKFLQKLMRTWPKQNWVDLFTLHMILHALPILPAPFDDFHFEVFGRVLRGQLKKIPQAQLTLNLSKKLLSIPFSYLYIHMYIKKELKKEVTDFAKTIVERTAQHLKECEWMEPQTREIAIRKVKSMRLGISHPDKLPTLSFPDLKTDNALENVYALYETRTNLYLEKVSETGNVAAEPEIWEEPPYVVNAYYYNELNEFFLPAGTLQFPFYIQSKEKIGWNYGGLGAIIGHEMTHAFDEEGKKYIDAGVRKDWWTRKDTLHYNRITKNLVLLFNKAKVRGNPVDGYLTLSENIADLGGLGIALDALLQELKGGSEEERKKQVREFFISYAVSWRVKHRPRRELQNLFLDVHAPAELRVNSIVSHFQEWYDAFDVKTGNELYIPPEERIVIF